MMEAEGSGDLRSDASTRVSVCARIDALRGEWQLGEWPHLAAGARLSHGAWLVGWSAGVLGYRPWGAVSSGSHCRGRLPWAW